MKVLDQHIKEDYTLYNADCVEVAKNLPDNSLDFSVFSPPFSSLYTYSNSDRDMGNTQSHSEFFEQFKFLLVELERTIKPGRLVAIHCMNLPTSKTRDGFIGMYDFRGDIIREMQNAGFIFHSEICIWKDPVLAMQRTKALGLLHKQVCKDSTMSRQGIPDHMVIFRKKGDNQNSVSGEFKYYVGETNLNEYTKRAGDRDCGNLFAEFEREDGRTIQDRADGSSIDIWQHYASPVWFDIRQTNTLQFRSAKENDDERHICPLQLDVIERCLQLWTNPGDVVFSPFLGIGSEGYMSVQLGRKFIGTELKPSYFKLACKNIDSVTMHEQLELL